MLDFLLASRLGRRFEAKAVSARQMRLKRGTQSQLESRFGRKVQRGFYTGMVLPEDNSWGHDTCGKILGVYETEVVSALQGLDWSRYTGFIDVGCADGFHAVGIAGAVPGMHVYAFDISENARRVTAAAARLNNVAERVTVAGAFSPDGLADGRYCMLLDIEGAEADFVDEHRRWLAGIDMVIECHDRKRGNVTERIKTALAATHDITTIQRSGRCPAELPVLGAMPDLDAWMVLSENRSNSSHWLLCLARA